MKKLFNYYLILSKYIETIRVHIYSDGIKDEEAMESWVNNLDHRSNQDKYIELSLIKIILCLMDPIYVAFP